MATIGVCLSGCGFLDGSEIHEAVCALIALDRAGAEVVCFAPNKPQAGVVDHSTQQAAGDAARNVLVESARIARGNIRNIKEVHGDEFDAVIFPGGFGAAKNLCSFATDGPDCQIDPDVERIVVEAAEAGRPIGAICIAPALITRILTAHGRFPRVTIGNDPTTAAAIESMGAKHVNCPPDDCVADDGLKVVTTPAYMSASGPAEVFAGVTKAVEAIMGMI